MAKAKTKTDKRGRPAQDEQSFVITVSVNPENPLSAFEKAKLRELLIVPPASSKEVISDAS